MAQLKSFKEALRPSSNKKEPVETETIKVDFYVWSAKSQSQKEILSNCNIVILLEKK